MFAEIVGIMGVASQALDFIGKNDVDELVKKGQLGWETKGSITKLIAETVISPRIIISESLKTNKDIDKIINLNIDIIAGMVSRAFFLLTEFKGFAPNSAFDILKTKKESVSGLESLLIPGVESDIYKTMKASKGLTFGKVISVGFEADKPAQRDDSGKMNRPKEDIPTLYSKDIDLKLTVATKDGGTRSISFPIIIKAHISYNSISRIKEDLIDKRFEKSMSERFTEYDAGLISLKNFALPFDMLEEYRKKRIKDVDSLLLFTEERSRLASSKIATAGMQSLGTYLGALIVSYDDMEDIENNILRGSIQKDSKREMLFGNAKMALLNIVDTDYEKITIITKDIEGQSLMDIKSLKKNSNGNDVNDLFKDLLMNKRF